MREVRFADEEAEFCGVVAPDIDAEHGVELVADHAHSLVAALLLRLHLKSLNHQVTKTNH
jgi:hypothetical protein